MKRKEGAAVGVGASLVVVVVAVVVSGRRHFSLVPRLLPLDAPLLLFDDSSARTLFSFITPATDAKIRYPNT
jgi:hypothetical protein